jgi:hypothetical protein
MDLHLCKMKVENDLCNISEHITKITGSTLNQGPNTTDVWFLYLDGDVRYRGIVLDDVRLEISISNDNIYSRKIIYGESFSSLGSFDEYEINIHNDVLSFVFDANLCPDFTTYYASGKCHYRDLRKILKQERTIEDVDFRIHRNITLLSNKSDYIPSIVSDEKVVLREDQHKYIRPNFVYNFQIKSDISGMDSFAKYVSEREDNFLSRNNAGYKKDLTMIFQICIICYVMSLSVMSHNNFKSQNILVERLDNSREMIYELFDSSECFSFNTDVNIKIDSFKDAYARRLGKKKSYEGNNCINENLDIITFFNSIFELTMRYRHVRNFLVPLLIEQGADVPNFNSQDELYLCNSTEEILYNLCVLLKQEDILRDASGRDVMFVCKQSLFFGKGLLKEQGVIEKVDNKLEPENDKYIFDYKKYSEMFKNLFFKIRYAKTDIAKKTASLAFFDSLLEHHESVKKFTDMIGLENNVLKLYSEKLLETRKSVPELNDPKYDVLL